MALYIPHSIFHLARLLLCQAGNFLTLLRINIFYNTSRFAKIVAYLRKAKNTSTSCRSLFEFHSMYVGLFNQDVM